METIDIDQAPSYEFELTRDNTTYGISLRTFEGMTFATVSVNGSKVASSVRCVPGSWLVPYSYQMSDGGNLRFECSDDEYPIYSNYGTSAKLVYYTPTEYAEAVG